VGQTTDSKTLRIGEEWKLLNFELLLIERNWAKGHENTVKNPAVSKDYAIK